MDVLTDVINRLRLRGTFLYHYELGSPWNVELPAFPDAVFHYLRRGSATVQLTGGETLRMTDGDLILITHGEPHALRSGRETKSLSLLDLDRRPAHLGIVHHGGKEDPFSTLICGYITLTHPTRTSVMGLLPAFLHLKPDPDWIETIMQRMVAESAVPRPGQSAMLARITELLFAEVLRSWVKSAGPGQSGWLGAIADPKIGKALQLIHERPEKTWTLSKLGRCVGLGRSTFAARFTKLVGQPMYRYLVARRMDEAALLLESSDEPIARIANRVGYEMTPAFSKVFRQHYGLSPSRYRAYCRK